MDLGEERQAAGVEGVLADLDRKLVGLAPVKTKVDQIASLLMVDRARQRFGLEAPRPNLHMCFTGEPGTGKTTVALKMAELLYRLGYLDSAKLVHAMRDDLVGEYIGQTAPKTKWVLERAMGGVLFIDEAYSLFRPADPKDYGQECIDILLQVMENDRDKLVVILAGYKDRMDVFFDSNPGMSSRVAHHLDFAPYTLDELVTIGQLDAGRLVLLPVRSGRDDLARAPGHADARAPVRQRPHRAERPGTGPAQSRPPAGLEHGDGQDPGRADAPGVRGHPDYRRSRVTNLCRSPVRHGKTAASCSPPTWAPRSAQA